MIEKPIIYVKENNKIIAREPAVVEKECWWCKNPFMYEVCRAPHYTEEIVYYQCCEVCGEPHYTEEIMYYQCCSCGASVNLNETMFKEGVGERR